MYLDTELQILKSISNILSRYSSIAILPSSGRVLILLFLSPSKLALTHRGELATVQLMIFDIYIFLGIVMVIVGGLQPLWLRVLYICAFKELAKAFDRVRHDFLFAVLEHAGLGEALTMA